MVGPDSIRAELPDADIIVNTLPLTPETHHILGPAEFEVVKHGTYLVNIGRGKTIDETAMIEALHDGRLSGAGLDVFETEPLPEDSPLWDMENVIITPHYSGLNPKYNQRVWEIFADNLERYVHGRELRNVVDKSLHY
jgi:phosphoglycerate dehydrogenase-like enzyme